MRWPQFQSLIQRADRSALGNALCVLGGALALMWPAIYNRFPFLYPDSMTYLDDGHILAAALFLHRYASYYGMRSLIYGLGILPLHWNGNPWPVVGMHALVTAYMLWLVVRSFALIKTGWKYLAIVTLLSFFTSASWYVSVIMPDILGGCLYLAIYLLVFARETLSRVERFVVYVIAWFAVCAHATHLLLAGGLVLVLAAFFLLRRQRLGTVARSLREVVVVLALAFVAQLSLNVYLYGRPTLDADRPAYLMARIIADGPGRTYLDQHCQEQDWAICQRLNQVTGDPDQFLWGDDGVWQNADQETQERLRREEMPFVLATIRAYPRQQLARSAHNFWAQLKLFGVEDFDPSGYILVVFDSTLPGQRSAYLHGRQVNNAMPLDFFNTMQFWVVIASLLAIAGLAPFVLRRNSSRLIGLTVILVFIVLANALIAGTMSMVDDRFQARIVWLLPLLAELFVLVQWPEFHRPPSASTAE